MDISGTPEIRVSSHWLFSFFFPAVFKFTTLGSIFTCSGGLGEVSAWQTAMAEAPNHQEPACPLWLKAEHEGSCSTLDE